MRKKNKLLSIAMVIIFTVAFLVPSLGMPATAAAAEPSVVTGSYDIDDDYVTLYADLNDSDKDYAVVEYGFYVDDTYAEVSSREGWSSEADDIVEGEFYLQIPVSDFEDGRYYYRAYVIFDDEEEENLGSIKWFDFDENGSNTEVDVDTVDADDIGDDYATLYAEIANIDTDEYTITSYGFYWDTDEDEVADGDEGSAEWDEVGDEALEEGDEFDLDVDDLEEDETYYFMAYVVYESDDDEYTAYGDVESFSTGESDEDLEVTTNSASSIDSDSAVLNGTIESYGDDNEIDEYGFYYGTSSSPSTKKMVGDDEDEIDEGEDFDYQLNNLKSGTKYYYRAYARNSDGIAYGTVRNFTTKGGAPVTTTTSSVFTIGMNYYLQNGTYQVMDAAPYIKNSRTYMPIRYVGYAMGLSDSQIQWNEATRTVILTKGNTTLVLVIGNPTIYVNGQARIMDVAPEITNSRTCLPIAWVAAAFGHTAVWNASTQQVTISSVTTTNPVYDKEPGDEVKVATNGATRIDEESARLNGEISDDGGLDIVEFGFYYGTERDDVEDGDEGDADVDEARGNEDLFYLDLDNLNDDTRYYFMAYAIDGDDNITYGGLKYFTTDEL